VALGVIWGLAVWTTDAPPMVDVALLLGWVLMPTILAISLDRPAWRYGLVLPASLVGIGLLAISIAWRPESEVAGTGWLLITGGVVLGGWLGLWLWYRMAPVPVQLDDPFAPGRLALIRAHVALIVVGIALAAVGLLPT
jgi:hypothetical protein